jgi:hypothetical protein
MNTGEIGMSRIFTESRFRVESKVIAFVLPKASRSRANSESNAPDSDLPDSNTPWIAADPAFATECGDAFREIRSALSAVLTLFGGTSPRGDDSPGAAARPHKLELLTVVSNRRSTDWLAKCPAEQEEIPYPAAA